IGEDALHAFGARRDLAWGACSVRRARRARCGGLAARLDRQVEAAQEGADIAASGYGGQVVDVAQAPLLRERLHDAERAGRAADAAAGDRESDPPGGFGAGQREPERVAARPHRRELLSSELGRKGFRPGRATWAGIGACIVVNCFGHRRPRSGRLRLQVRRRLLLVLVVRSGYRSGAGPSIRGADRSSDARGMSPERRSCETCALTGIDGHRPGQETQVAAQDFILAIDQGTTSTRAIVFDSGFRAVWVGQQEFDQHFPDAGWVEHEAEDLWRTTVATVQHALLAARIDAGRLAGIGITNQRETTVVWDRKTGRAIHRAIVWQDRRTADMCNRLRADGLEP